MLKIMVTGGTGFIGSHTCLLLLEKGYELVIVDSYVNSSYKSIENIFRILGKKYNNLENKVQVFNLDLRNKKKIDEIFLNEKLAGKPIDGVIHFAGLKSVTESISRPLDYWDSNLISTIHLLQVMDKHNCKTIVFSSSANIYRQNEDKKLNENHEISPTNPYGKTKFVIEQLLEDVFDCSKDWRIANLRYFNPIGAHESGLIGEDPIGIPNNIYPTLTQVAIGKIKKLHIYGNDWPTKDGTALRDYIHVMDLAEGHLLVYEYLFKNNPQIIKLNLGTGKITSVLELVNTFKKVNNVEIPYIFDKRREGDYGVVVADNSLASSLLDWTPQRTIEDMCKDGWRWQEKNPSGFI